VLSYLHFFIASLIEPTPHLFSRPLFNSPSMYMRDSKTHQKPGSVVAFGFGISGRILISFRVAGTLLDIPRLS